MRILAVDVGTGTQDILLFDSDDAVENSLQLIMPSPTRRVAEQVRQATAARRPLLLDGVLMGGGPGHWAVNDHLKAGLPVLATPTCARTFDDDLTKVAASGIELVEDTRGHEDAIVVQMRDLDLAAIGAALAAFGVEPAWDVLAVAVFDHGNAPPDVSDRKFRFDYLAERLKPANGTRGWLTDLAFGRDEIPTEMTRLQAVAATAPTATPLLVMDTAPAAVLGALDDPRVRSQSDAIIANIGNFHALAFHIASEGGPPAIRGLFEHHTGELTAAQLGTLLDRLADGTLTNAEVFGSQGHGALLLDPTPAHNPWLATTGPRQRMLSRWRDAAPYRAVPHGDMMLAGCFGLLRAVAARMPEHAAEISAALDGAS